jgi:hypothetical protein
VCSNFSIFVMFTPCALQTDVYILFSVYDTDCIVYCTVLYADAVYLHCTLLYILRRFILLTRCSNVVLKNSLPQHTYKFSRLLVSALLTNWHQTLYFIKSCPVKTYPICMGKFHWTALDKVIKVWWWYVNKAEANNLENLYVCCGRLFFNITFTVLYVSFYFSNTHCSPAVTHVSLTRSRDMWTLCEQRELSHDACWILCDFSCHCEDRRLDDGPKLFWSDYMFITLFYLTKCLTQAELSAHRKMFQIRT